MANAIIRDVVVKRSSTAEIFNIKSKESDKEDYDTISFDKCSEIDHHLVECSSSTDAYSDSSQNTRIGKFELLQREILLGITPKSDNNKNVTESEPINFHRPNTSTENSTGSLKTFETFSNQNISSSTTIENTSTEEFSEAHTFGTTPPNVLDSTRALDILQQIRSPLYDPHTNTPTKGFSLRSQQPFYAQSVSPIKEFISRKPETIFKVHINQSPIEVISMNGGKPLNNGPVGTFPKTNSSGVIGNAAIDINRNNDTPRNWTVMTSANTEKREHLYKILVIGELGTGKTSFIKRYVHQFFSQNYRATIGVDFALKVLHWDPNTIVRLQLWDIAGQERFGNMTRVYYKEAVGAFIVFDVTRSGTFDCVSKWKEDLDSKVQLPDGSQIPCILLANKCDQDKQGVVTNIEKMDEYVKEHGFAGWFETSAKENINIDEAARALVNKILLNDKLISAADLADSEKFNLNNTADQTALDGKSKCSC